MLSRMDPSSPPEKRTYHLLKTPDILCANDSGHPFSNNFGNTTLPIDGMRRSTLIVASAKLA
jgi:hypothetical protein